MTEQERALTTDPVIRIAAPGDRGRDNSRGDTLV